MIKKIIAIILILEIIIKGIACHSYSTLKVEDRENSDAFENVRITTTDDKVYTLTQVRIDSSHLRGMVSLSQSELLAGKQKNEIAIPLQDIKEFEVREYDSTLTSYVILGVGIALLAIILISTASMGSGLGLK